MKIPDHPTALFVGRGHDPRPRRRHLRARVAVGDPVAMRSVNCAMRASAPADTGCYWVEAAIISYEACRQRKAGFKKALSAKVPGVRYFADQPGFLTDEARTTAAEIITAKANVDALYAANEGGTVGALKGIQATRHAGRTVVLGSDISAQIAEAMLAQRKTLVLTVGQGAQRMRRVAVQQALRAVRGEQIAQFDTYISTREFTSANPQGLRSWLAAHKDACRRCAVGSTRRGRRGRQRRGAPSRGGQRGTARPANAAPASARDPRASSGVCRRGDAPHVEMVLVAVTVSGASATASAPAVRTTTNTTNTTVSGAPTPCASNPANDGRRPNPRARARRRALRPDDPRPAPGQRPGRRAHVLVGRGARRPTRRGRAERLCQPAAARRRSTRSRHYQHLDRLAVGHRAVAVG